VSANISIWRRYAVYSTGSSLNGSFLITRRCWLKDPDSAVRWGITPIMEAEQMRQLLDSIPIVRKVKIPRKHDGGIKRWPTSRGSAIEQPWPSCPIRLRG
jgi:hypothetical protein